MLAFLAASAFEVKGGQWWPEGSGGRTGRPAGGQGEAKHSLGERVPGKREVGTWEALFSICPGMRYEEPKLDLGKCFSVCSFEELLEISEKRKL